MAKQPAQHQRADLWGLGGYGCLSALALSGFLGGCALIFFGVSVVIKAGQEDVSSGADAQQLIIGLEGAVALVGFGALCLLIALVAAVVLLKELSDDVSRRERGPVR